MLVSRLRPWDPPTAGPYLLLGRIASGGMGVVYLGREDGRPDSLVAVKSVRPDPGVSPQFVERLRAEARLSEELARNVPSPYGLARFVRADPEAERPWVATEYVPGPSLHDAARGRALAEPDVAALSRTLAGCLAALHAAEYAHRDVKPANIVMGPDGARVVDLGLARAVGAPNEVQLMGSPGWSPPERYDADQDPRPRDVHGWGMSVAYASCGRPAFGTGPAEAVTRRMLQGSPQLDGIAGPLRALVAAALDPDPANRPCAAELVDVLARPGVPSVLPPAQTTEGDVSSATREGVPPAPHTERLSPPTVIDDAVAAPPRRAARPDRAHRTRRGIAAAAACTALTLGALALVRGADVPGAAAAGRAQPTATASAAPRPSHVGPSPTVLRATGAAHRAPVPSTSSRHGKGKHHQHRH